jgi:hypothetical protein
VIDNEKSSAHMAQKYAQVWLSRYPYPEHCVHNNVGEFVGPEFQFLLQGCHMKDTPTSRKNPQANAICAWMHQTVGNVLHTLLHGEPPQDFTRAKDFIDEVLSIAMHEIWTGMQTTYRHKGSMFLNILLITDWHTITQKREHLVNENLRRESNKQRHYNYVPSHKILKKNPKSRKLGRKTSGLYKVLQTHVNGTLTIELKPGISETIKTRRVITYKE